MPARGERLSLGALLLPWMVLTLLLPLPHMIAGFGLLTALGALLWVAVRWSHMRAEALALDAEAWGLAAVLSLGFSMGLLIGAEGKSAYQAMCGDCGRLQDARNSFCHACGAFA